MRNEAPTIRAAGAVLWRPSRKHGVRIAVVHRPRYDDWSLPKGKAEPGESAQVTAWREVWEETGFRSELGRALTAVSYSVTGGGKTVQYFAARCRAGAFTTNKEVDKLDWLSIPAARARMSYEFDKAVLDTFSLERPDLAGVILLRHARAGHRESFEGEDADRPLDTKGRKQAQALMALLMPFAPTAVHSAPVRRCLATVAPLAAELGATVVLEPRLAEDAYRDDPAGARHRLVELATAQVVSAAEVGGGMVGSTIGIGTPAAGIAGMGVDGALAAGVTATDSGPRTVVACSQGGVIPGVVKSLAGRSDIAVPRTGTPKGAFWYLCFDGRRLVQADPYPAPTV